MRKQKRLSLELEVYFTDISSIKNLTNEEEKYFLEKINEKNSQNKLIENYVGLVKNIALSFNKSNYDELISIGNEKLTELIKIDKLKDYNTEFSLKNYIYSAIKHKIFDYFRKRKKNNYITLKEEFFISHKPNPVIQEVENNESILRVKSALKKIDKIELSFLIKKFNEDLTHDEISKQTGLSKPTVSRRIQKSLDDLRQKFIEAG